jgi:hypothetical protein
MQTPLTPQMLPSQEANNGSIFMIDAEEMMIWCKDDQRHQLSVFMVDDGRSVCLVPNHRANAMAKLLHFFLNWNKMFDLLT